MRPAAVRALPVLPWSAASRWRPRPLTLAVLVAGLWCFGTGEAMLVDSGLGNTPWTVLALGLSRHTPLSIGAATIVIAAVVLLGWWPLRERPGLGTLLNLVLIGVAIDVMLPLLPQPTARPAALAEVVVAIAAIGTGSALYLSAMLGPGPRDGWMTGIARRTDRPIAGVRLAIEAAALTSGWLLGGRVGIGTVLFALTIGHAVSLAVGSLARVARASRAT
jgi:uncharacterized membrane protein YczE